MEIENKYIIVDIETCANTFILNALEKDTGKKRSFIFFDNIDELTECVKFIKRCINHEYYWVTFNGVNFDLQIIYFILENYDWWIKDNLDIQRVIQLIYIEAQRLIALTDDNRMFETVAESKLPFNNIDLFKQKHYNRKQRATSLKWLQFSMRYPNIEEQPYDHSENLNKEQVKEVAEYCWNDVDSTGEFFKRIYFETELRVGLSEKYGMNLLNASEPKIARDIFAKYLCKEMKISYADLKKMRTDRKIIALKDILLPYIDFKSKELNTLLENIKTQKIDVFAPNFKYDFKYGGLEHYIGLGGIHSCIEEGVYEPANDELMIDLDVASFYPNLAIKNNLRPQHLGEVFTKVYGDIYEQRKLYDKKNPINYVFKIILNSLFGLSKEPNGYVYDPKLTYSITVNGQLSLLMLYEKIFQTLKYTKFIQCNTDGLTLIIKKEEYDLLKSICKWWEDLTQLALEEAKYTKMVINDVNNYLSISTKGEIKKKGLFETEMDFHKNPSFLIINKALEAYFIKGTSVEDFIRNCTDIYDFCGGVKKKSNFKLNLHYIKDGRHIKENQQKVTRFFVSNKGGQLMKDFNDRRQVSVLSKFPVTIASHIKDENATNYDINYRWYITETKKIITNIMKNTNQLKLF